MTSQTTFTSCMHDQMLESNRDDVKLEAMRCVTVMTAKGKLSVPRTLFPHIVKNVSSKNPELKKLIYLYLTNFADQEPDLALLPVATLQKSLKSPNPLIRSSALKVLTSMRLNILSAILMAALRNSVNDLSPYVRKTVAHSIIKIYLLDPSLKSDLVEYIERLLNDKNSMVLSSVVAAFQVVCPERLDLVQKHYRRFCFILADCNEWGQTLLMKLLVRCTLKTCKPSKKDNNIGSADQDPKILLRSAKPLVHSNNAAVVLAVTKLFISIANHNEVRSTITRPLIRLLYSHTETQLVVLEMIENLTSLSESNISSLLNSDTEEQDVAPLQNISSTIPEEVLDSDNILDTHRSDNISRESSDANSTSFEKLPENEEAPTTRYGYMAIDEDVTESQSKNDTSANNDYEVIGNTQDGQLTQVQTNHTESGSGADSGEETSGDETSDESEESSEEEDSDEETDEVDDESSDDAQEVSDPEINASNKKRTGAIKNDSDESDKDDDKKEFNTNYIDLSANKDPNAYREMFRPHIKSFYVKHTDCTQIRIAKLKILTNLSSPVNVSQILRELQAYIAIYVDDKEFVSASIHAIGRCAMIVKEVAHICLTGLTTLLSNNNEHVVSEAIVVLRSQIMNKKIKGMPNKEKSSNEVVVKTTQEKDENQCDEKNNTKQLVVEHDEDNSSPVDDDDKMVSAVIKQVTKLLPTVTAPQARATILWILAEFSDKNLTAAKCTPNVLRLIAKSFCQEDNFVKLQSLSLASKFLLSLDKETKSELHTKIRLIASYLFSLAKYDANHDVRDRGRFLEKLLENEDICAKVLNSSGHQTQPEMAA